jgi:RNA polymerase sigma-70 factor (ECF subfamily)
MSGDSPGRITHLLHRAATGDQDAETAVVQALYAELHRLARRQMRRERRQITLQPTALVNEAFVRLMRGADGAWADRGHFFAAAANAMRRILVDYARSRRAAKRGNGAELAELQDGVAQVAHSPETLLAIDAVLHRLAEIAPRQARIVEMRFFAGLTEEEVASALGISSRTVKREWTKAKAFLYERLQS